MATLLPVGTILKLKEQEQKVMVAGYGGYNLNDEIHDYIGLPTPMGIVDKNLSFVFNSADVESIVYLGYLDASTQVYINEIEKTGKDKLPVFSKKLEEDTRETDRN